jgi:hypothetical protein
MSYKPQYHTLFYLENLRYLDVDLANRVAGLVEKQEDGSGRVRIDASILDETTKAEFLNSLPLLGRMKAPTNLMAQHQLYQKAVDADIAEQGRRIKEKNAAIARLEQYGAQGLLPSDKNVREITNYIDTRLPEKLRGRWTVQTVEVAVGYLTQEGQLEYKKPEPVAAPTPATPTVTLSDGTPQLQLGTTPARHHSILQLRDLDQRERTARGRAQGTFGSRF